MKYSKKKGRRKIEVWELIFFISLYPFFHGTRWKKVVKRNCRQHNPSRFIKNVFLFWNIETTSHAILDMFKNIQVRSKRRRYNVNIPSNVRVPRTFLIKEKLSYLVICSHIFCYMYTHPRSRCYCFHWILRFLEHC